MREIQVLTWCDECFNDGAERTPSTNTFTIGAVTGEMTHPPVKVLELCDVHAKRVTELIDLLNEVGQTPNKPGPNIASKGFRGLPAAQKQLRSNAPELGLPRVQGTIGLVSTLESNPISECPICHQELREKSRVTHVYTQHLGGLKNRPPQPAVCPDCRMADESSMAMMQHRIHSHGWSPLGQALDMYERQGRSK